MDAESDKVISNSTPFENSVDKLWNEREKINGHFNFENTCFWWKISNVGSLIRIFLKHDFIHKL